MVKSVRELFDLTGKVAIVTGGSRGLGKEIAEGLAEAGASLMICARRERWVKPTLEEFQARGFNVLAKVADVSRPEDIEAVVKATIEAFGKIDILVNNAGTSWGCMPEDMPLDKFQLPYRPVLNEKNQER